MTVRELKRKLSCEPLDNEISKEVLSWLAPELLSYKERAEKAEKSLTDKKFIAEKKKTLKRLDKLLRITGYVPE